MLMLLPSGRSFSRKPVLERKRLKTSMGNVRESAGAFHACTLGHVDDEILGIRRH